MFLGLLVKAFLDNLEPCWITCVSGLFCDIDNSSGSNGNSIDSSIVSNSLELQPVEAMVQLAPPA